VVVRVDQAMACKLTLLNVVVVHVFPAVSLNENAVGMFVYCNDKATMTVDPAGTVAVVVRERVVIPVITACRVPMLTGVGITTTPKVVS
jgi:hypothetical protein